MRPGLRSANPGSDKSVAFRLFCDPKTDWVVVFEALIDMMSFCTINRNVNCNAIALCGLYDGPLETYLRKHRTKKGSQIAKTVL